MLTSATRAGVAFQMQQQDEDDWCWAAVAVSVHAFLDPNGRAWTQPTLATAVMQRQMPAAGLNCSVPDQAASPRGCNQAEPLDLALSITRNLNQYLPGTRLSFQQLLAFFGQHLPVCVRIVWRGGGAHFVALGGGAVSASGRRLVFVYDPLPPLGTLPRVPAYTAPSICDYDALLDHYEITGSWHDSYLVEQ
jgi:hypothetical protein